MTPHRSYDRLSKVCRAAAAVFWEGAVFRSATPRYASSHDLVSGRGARRHGGRWNAPGTANAVYASTSPEAAMKEAFQQTRTAGIPDTMAMPRVFVAIHVRVDRALDLTSPAMQSALGVSRAKLVNCDWEKANDLGKEALTQALGRAALAAGFKALVVPSAADPNGTNLVVFPAVLGRQDRLIVLDPAKLPGQRGDSAS